VVCAVLLVLGAVTGGGAVREHWLSCRGTMLSGSALHGYAYGPDFSDACLQTMDNGFSFTWPDGMDSWRPEAAFGTACSLLLALAWMVVIAASTWSYPTRLLAAPPAILTAAAGLISAFAPSSDALDTAYVVLLVAISLTSVTALTAIGVRKNPGRWTLCKAAIALAGSSAVGFFAQMADYSFMTSFSDANWDTPPGTGYPTVVAMALLGFALLAVTFAARPQRGTKNRDLVEVDA